MRTLEEQLRVAMAPSKGAAAITTALGVVTLCLAGAGVYAMTAFLVAARRREIGIRLALGASRAQILQLASHDGLHITTVGLAVGLVLAFVAARLLNAYVGIAIGGIVPIGAVSAAVVCGSVALAAWRPLRRSLTTDPVRVLRAE
jgi:ABC-type antimicrobial peptide transport system permease subunit